MQEHHCILCSAVVHILQKSHFWHFLNQQNVDTAVPVDRRKCTC